MTVPREWTRAEAEQAVTAVFQKRSGCGEECVICPDDARLALDALGLAGTFTVVPGRLEQVGWVDADKWWYYTPDAEHPDAAEPVYRVVPELETP